MAWRYWSALQASALALCLTALGCASTSSLLRQRFSREHGCQKDEVRVREAGANAYLAEGCGQHAEYVCSTFMGGKGFERSCQERGVVPNASPEPPKRTYVNLEEPPR